MRAARAIALAFVVGVSGGALFGTTTAFAEPSASDLESARALYQKGKELRAAGDLRGALEKFAAAHSLYPTPITGVELGRTQMQLGLLVEARASFLDVKSLAEKPNESPATKDARAEAAKLAEDLKPRIPSLVFAVVGAPAGESPTITVDGAIVPPAALAEERKVDPGKHLVVAKLSDGREARSEASVKEGEHATVTLDFGSTTSAGASTTTTTTESTSNDAGTKAHGDRTLAWIGFGVAGAGVAVGAVTGLLAYSKLSSAKNSCVDKTCYPDARSDLDASHGFGTISTIAFVVAGVGAAVGVVALVTSGHDDDTKKGAPAPQVALGVGASSLWLTGSF